jgi:hypothetical protein
MKFFTIDDFKSKLEGKAIVWPNAWQEMVDVANEKLDLAGKVVYGKHYDNQDYFCTWKDLEFKDGSKATHEALIIDIKLIKGEVK